MPVSTALPKHYALVDYADMQWLAPAIAVLPIDVFA
jgi:hypothetical protein